MISNACAQLLISVFMEAFSLIRSSSFADVLSKQVLGEMREFVIF